MKMKTKKPAGNLKDMRREFHSVSFGYAAPLTYPDNHPRAIYKAAKKAAKLAKGK